MTGELLNLHISGIAHGGLGIARHEGRVVFVSDTIPGEQVVARLSDTSKASFWRADTVAVAAASEHRQQHVWPEARIDRDPQHRPGGADFGHIVLSEQRRLKTSVLTDALMRFGRLQQDEPVLQTLAQAGVAEVTHPAVAEDGTGWRTRISIPVDQDGRIGPYAARSHQVIRVGSYPLAAAEIEQAARELRDEQPGRVELVLPSNGKVQGRRVPERGARPKRQSIKQRTARGVFELDAAGFWQVHPAAADTLDHAIAGLLTGLVDPEASHLDLYGGVGLFSATLRGLGARHITTVESDRIATGYAAKNVRGVAAVTDRVDRWIRRDDLSGVQTDSAGKHRLGAVILDPPRSGAGKAVVQALVRHQPEAVVYVACDPVAFSRDLGYFRDLGWDAEQIQAFDLFPHTHHFETVALLRPGN